MEESSLRDKTVKGVGWSTADAFLGQGVHFLIGLVLARLLSPEEYGLIGIVTIFITIMSGFVDCGFSNALIRKPQIKKADYNTMFIVNLTMSFALYVLLYLCSPYIAEFFERPLLIPLIRVASFLLLFQALSIVQYTVLSRNIDFKTKTKSSLISSVLSGIIGITMALAGMGVWSLVGQQLSRSFIYTTCMWAYIHWKPSLRFNLDSFRYMWSFGWKLMLSGLLDRLWAQLYQAVVGKYYNPATLGQYTRAKDYASIFSSNLTGIVQRVSYPVLSQVQNEKEKMMRGYRKIIKSTMFVTAIILISMGAVSGPLIYCLIGPQWGQAADFMPLICISMSIYPLHAINLNMLQVQNRTDIFLILEIIKKIIAIAPICLGIFVSIYWMLIGTIITGFIAFFLNSYYTGKKLGYSSWMQLRDIVPSYGLAFIIALSVYFFKFLPISNWIILPIQICVGTIVFFVVCEHTQMEEYFEVKSMVIQYLYKLRKNNNK